LETGLVVSHVLQVVISVTELHWWLCTCWWCYLGFQAYRNREIPGK